MGVILNNSFGRSPLLILSFWRSPFWPKTRSKGQEHISSFEFLGGFRFGSLYNAICRHGAAYLCQAGSPIWPSHYNPFPLVISRINKTMFFQFSLPLVCLCLKILTFKLELELACATECSSKVKLPMWCNLGFITSLGVVMTQKRIVRKRGKKMI